MPFDSIRAPRRGRSFARSARATPSVISRLRTAVMVAAVLSSSVAGAALAQSFPVKSVRMVITFPPGGPVDFVARGLADELAKVWGQPVLVDNRPGGGGTIGNDIVRSAPADGYNLLLGTHSGMIAAPLLNPSVKYHPLKDFTPISQVVNSPFFLVANSAVPANTVKELLALMRAQPGKFNYGSVGQGSSTHLAFEMFTYTTKTEALHVPYKGTAPMLIDLLSGTLQLTITSIPTVLPHVKSGKLKAIANGSLKRSVALPDTPTFDEGGMPGFESVTWYGVVGPAKLPRPLVKDIHAATVRALATPGLLARYTEAGLETIGSTPEQFGAFIAQEYTRWDKLIKLAGIKSSQ